MMLLHRQKSLYYMDMEDKEKDNLRDIVLVAINEVTKFDKENMDGNRYDVGVDFSNILPFKLSTDKSPSLAFDLPPQISESRNPRLQPIN